MKKLFKMGDTRETTNQSHWQLISLTVLRIAIGWHFLYEGLLKVTSPDWSASYYLYNSTGPFASIFKSMALSPIVLGLTDILNQWGLVIIGISLMNGFISRWACLGGMVLLALYYLANPLFIGLGDTSISEGYYLIVNNNLIEFIALWILFQFRDSKVYGIDYFFSLVTDKEWGKNVKVPKI